MNIKRVDVIGYQAFNGEFFLGQHSTLFAATVAVIKSKLDGAVDTSTIGKMLADKSVAELMKDYHDGKI